MAQLQNLKINNTDIFDLFYPIGSIYETSNAEFNPNNVWSGTWERIKGKVIVGVDEDDTDFENSQLSGGSKSVTLTKSQMPSVTGNIQMHAAAVATFIHGVDGCFSGNSVSSYALAGSTSSNAHSFGNVYFNNGGQGQAHTNLQPYYTAYIWERIS